MGSLDYLFRVGQDWGLRGQDWDLRGQDWDLQDQDWGLRGQDLGLQSWPRRTNGRMDGNSPLCSTGVCPLWVRCPASLCITFKNDEQGMGTADHIISLDYLFRCVLASL